VYSLTKIWGANLGKGGIDLNPSDERSAPAPPEGLSSEAEFGSKAVDKLGEDLEAKAKLLPRETGEDIGMGSPVALSDEAVGIITRLRNMKVNLLVVCTLL
jgi:tRNA pseudouridine32 synthase